MHCEGAVTTVIDTTRKCNKQKQTDYCKCRDTNQIKVPLKATLCFGEATLGNNIVGNMGNQKWAQVGQPKSFSSNC
jgi:hypothetical protein